MTTVRSRIFRWLMTYYLLGGFAPIPVTNLLAQAPQFEAYGLAEGLSQEYVNALVKDRRGFLWIGTQDGLNRFDGYTFKHYRRHKKDPHGLPGNFINARKHRDAVLDTLTTRRRSLRTLCECFNTTDIRRGKDDCGDSQKFHQ